MEKNLSIGTLAAAPGEKVQGMLPIPHTEIEVPVTLINGAGGGKTVLVTSGIHSCEYVGIEAAIQLAGELDPASLNGSLILIHPVNVPGFESRYPTLMPQDNKNLNRVFPGTREGTLADRVAHFFEYSLYSQIDFYIDLHCGEIFEDLTPYVYYVGAADNAVSEAARQAALHVDVPYMVKSAATTGAYNYAGVLGIPSILLERGCAGRFTQAEVDADKKDVINILKHLGVLQGAPELRHRPVDLTDLVYLMPARHGLWYPEVKAGDLIAKGQRLGVVKDYFGQVLDTYCAEYDGVVLYQSATLWTDDFCELITYGKFAETAGMVR